MKQIRLLIDIETYLVCDHGKFTAYEVQAMNKALTDCGCTMRWVTISPEVRNTIEISETRVH